MLPVTERISRTQFAHYFTSGRRLHSPTCTLVFVSANTRHGSVVVSKKVSRKAVVRNTLRRRVYAVFRQATAGKTGVYIFLLKPTASTLSKLTLADEIRELIGRTGKSQ